MMNSDIRSRCEAIARLEQQRKELAAEIKELKATAKADGYDVSLITKTVSLMLKDADKQKKAIEQHELFDTYLNAVGLLSEPEEPDEREEVKKTATRYRQEDTAALAQEMADSGFISQEAADETRAIAQAINNKWGDAKPLQVSLPDGASRPVESSGGWTVSADAPAAPIQDLPKVSPALPTSASEAAGDPTPPAADHSMPEIPSFLDRRIAGVAH